MPRGSDDTLAKQCLLKVIEVVRAVMHDTSRAEALLDEAQSVAERIDRARGKVNFSHTEGNGE